MILLIVVGFLLLLVYGTRKPKNFPPGPPRFPLVGALPTLLRLDFKFMYKALDTLTTKYGPICGLYVSSRPLVVITGYDEYIAAAALENLSARPPFFFARLRAYWKNLGVLFSRGPLWKEQRRFTLRHLRDFGFGKQGMEDILRTEVENLIAKLSTKGNEVLDLPHGLTLPVLNVLWTMQAGTRFHIDDPKLKYLLEKVDASFRAGGATGGYLNMFPWLRFIIPKLSGYVDTKESVESLQAFLKETIKEHKQTLDPANSRDFIDVFLIEMGKQTDPNTTFTEEQLITASMDLFVAGSETTSNTLGFGLLYVTSHPEIQKKIHEELDRIVGHSRMPVLADRSNMPYMEAVLMEIQRISNVAPFTPPHQASDDVTCNGYTIRKGTTVLFSIYSIHMSKDYWGDPENFRPERFINIDGSLKKDTKLIPFGSGKRVCLGETLAKASLFVFFSSLMHRFSFSFLPEDGQPSFEPRNGFTLSPQPFRVKATPRF